MKFHCGVDLSSVYFFGSLCKLNSSLGQGDFVSGESEFSTPGPMNDDGSGFV